MRAAGAPDALWHRHMPPPGRRLGDAQPLVAARRAPSPGIAEREEKHSHGLLDLGARIFDLLRDVGDGAVEVAGERALPREGLRCEGLAQVAVDDILTAGEGGGAHGEAAGECHRRVCALARRGGRTVTGAK